MGFYKLYFIEHVYFINYLIWLIFFVCSFQKNYKFLFFFFKYTHILLIVLLLVQIRKSIAYTLLLSNCCECRGPSVPDTAASVCFWLTHPTKPHNAPLIS